MGDPERHVARQEAVILDRLGQRHPHHLGGVLGELPGQLLGGQPLGRRQSAPRQGLRQAPGEAQALGGVLVLELIANLVAQGAYVFRHGHVYRKPSPGGLATPDGPSGM